MSVNNNPVYPPLVRVKGNREPIDAILQDNTGAAVDLTGRTIVFRMTNIATETVKVNNQSATITDAEDGEVRYTPTATDVDTAGDYAMYFIDTTSTPHRWYPYDGARYRMTIVEEWEAQ